MTLYIREYCALAPTTGGNNLAMGAEPGNRDQQITSVSSTSLTSSSFLQNSYYIRLHTDAICSVNFGSTPTATTTNARLAANQTEYFAVIPGQKVAVILNT